MPYICNSCKIEHETGYVCPSPKGGNEDLKSRFKKSVGDEGSHDVATWCVIRKLYRDCFGEALE